MNDSHSTKLHLLPQSPSLREQARQIVAEYFEAHPPSGLNEDAYRKLAAYDAIESLMDQHGTEWVELRAQEIATARRLRGVK